MDKQQEWQGYYDYYFAEARCRSGSPLDVLDQQWFDGRTTAQDVLPYISTESTVLEIACGIAAPGDSLRRIPVSSTVPISGRSFSGSKGSA